MAIEVTDLSDLSARASAGDEQAKAELRANGGEFADDTPGLFADATEDTSQTDKPKERARESTAEPTAQPDSAPEAYASAEAASPAVEISNSSQPPQAGTEVAEAINLPQNSGGIEALSVTAGEGVEPLDLSPTEQSEAKEALDAAIADVDKQIAKLKLVHGHDSVDQGELVNLQFLRAELHAMKAFVDMGYFTPAQIHSIAQGAQQAIGMAQAGSDARKTEHRSAIYAEIFSSQESAEVYYREYLMGLGFDEPTSIATLQGMSHVFSLEDQAQLAAENPEGFHGYIEANAQMMSQRPEEQAILVEHAQRPQEQKDNAKEDVAARLEDIYQKFPHLRGNKDIEYLLGIGEGTLSPELLESLESAESVAHVDQAVGEQKNKLNNKLFDRTSDILASLGDGDVSYSAYMRRGREIFGDEFPNVSQEAMRQKIKEMIETRQANGGEIPDELKAQEQFLMALSTSRAVEGALIVEQYLEKSLAQAQEQGVSAEFDRVLSNIHSLPDLSDAERGTLVHSMLTRESANGTDKRQLANDATFRNYVIQYGNTAKTTQELQQVVSRFKELKPEDLASLTQHGLLAEDAAKLSPEALQQHQNQLLFASSSANQKQLASFVQEPEFAADFDAMMVKTAGFIPPQLAEASLAYRVGSIDAEQLRASIQQAANEGTFIGDEIKRGSLAEALKQPAFAGVVTQMMAQQQPPLDINQPESLKNWDYRSLPDRDAYGAAYNATGGNPANADAEQMQTLGLGMLRGNIELGAALASGYGAMKQAQTDGIYVDEHAFVNMPPDQMMKFLETTGVLKPDTFAHDFGGTFVKLSQPQDFQKLLDLMKDADAAYQSGDRTKAEAVSTEIQGHITDVVRRSPEISAMLDAQQQFNHAVSEHIRTELAQSGVAEADITAQLASGKIAPDVYSRALDMVRESAKAKVAEAETLSAEIAQSNPINPAPTQAALEIPNPDFISTAEQATAAGEVAAQSQLNTHYQKDKAAIFAALADTPDDPAINQILVAAHQSMRLEALAELRQAHPTMSQDEMERLAVAQANATLQADAKAAGLSGDALKPVEAINKTAIEDTLAASEARKANTEATASELSTRREEILQQAVDRLKADPTNSDLVKEVTALYEDKFFREAEAGKTLVIGTAEYDAAEKAAKEQADAQVQKIVNPNENEQKPVVSVSGAMVAATGTVTPPAAANDVTPKTRDELLAMGVPANMVDAVLKAQAQGVGANGITHSGGDEVQTAQNTPNAAQPAQQGATVSV